MYWDVVEGLIALVVGCVEVVIGIVAGAHSLYSCSASVKSLASSAMSGGRRERSILCIWRTVAALELAAFELEGGTCAGEGACATEVCACSTETGVSEVWIVDELVILFTQFD